MIPQTEMAKPMSFGQKPKNDKKPKYVEICQKLVSVTLKGSHQHVVKHRPKSKVLRCLSSLSVPGASL
jgi:hypothetical protein